MVQASRDIVELPPIADHPTKEDATKPLDLLLGLLEEFPFVDELDTAVAVSGLMTPVSWRNRRGAAVLY